MVSWCSSTQLNHHQTFKSFLQGWWKEYRFPTSWGRFNLHEEDKVDIEYQTGKYVAAWVDSLEKCENSLIVKLVYEIEVFIEESLHKAVVNFTSPKIQPNQSHI